MIMILTILLLLLIIETLSYYNIIVINNNANRYTRYSRYSKTTKVALHNTNKRIEIALKIKRLKQMKDNGKDYNDYINEQKKYDIINKINDNSITVSVNMTEKIKLMEKVITYKNNNNNNSTSIASSSSRSSNIDNNNNINSTNSSSSSIDNNNNINSTNSSSSIDNNINDNTNINTNINNNSNDINGISQSTRIAFLPDVGYNEKCHFFYKHLATKGLTGNPSSNINFIDMPDITELNTKRYEQTWMNYMRDLNLNAKYDVIIGHGTSADALIRYLESERLPKAVFIDCADIYTAGERHGRAYLYPRIRDNCKHIRIVALTKKGANDALTLRKELDHGIYNLDPIIEDYDSINDYDYKSLIDKVMCIMTKAINLI